MTTASVTTANAGLLWLSPNRPYLGCTFHVKQASEAWERAATATLRREVFCSEQGLFEDDDRDAIDITAIPLAAISFNCGMPDRVVGTVRIHSPTPRQWFGSRLAVATSHRRSGRLGVNLIRLAVGHANALGCDTFLAHVQERNITLFKRLHWHTIDTLTLHGHPHHLMQADLEHYPPIADANEGLHLHQEHRHERTHSAAQ